MKNRILFVSMCMLGASIMAAMGSGADVYAVNDCGGDFYTTILECPDGDGADSVCHILNLIIEIMSIGVGILGVVGILIMGIQYLTAGGNEEKTRKAKRRLLELVIGVGIYAVMASVVAWLNPGGVFECESSSSAGGGASSSASGTGGSGSGATVTSGGSGTRSEGSERL